MAEPEFGSGELQVVVVDNASPDPIPERLRLYPPSGLRLLVRPDNGGFAVGVNAGWRLARSDWLLVLNPDVEIASGLISQVIERIERIGGQPCKPPGIVGFALKNPDGSTQGSVGVFPSLWRTITEQFIPRSRRKYQAGWRIQSGPVDWVTGACMLVNSRMMAELGGMDEDFFLYHEEVAFSRSAQDRGWRVEYDAGVQCDSPTSLAESGHFAQDAGHHPAQQAALFSEALARVAVPGIIVDRHQRIGGSWPHGMGPGSCGGGPGMEDHSRHDPPAPRRGIGSWTGGAATSRGDRGRQT